MRNWSRKKTNSIDNDVMKQIKEDKGKREGE